VDGVIEGDANTELSCFFNVSLNLVGILVKDVFYISYDLFFFPKAIFLFFLKGEL
jgi:hypothetical protein